jgi:hypothetical protein
MAGNHSNTSWHCEERPKSIVSIFSINFWLIVYWITGALSQRMPEQIVLMCLSLGLYNFLNDFSLVLILVSQLLRSARYVKLFGEKGVVAVMVFSLAITVYNFSKCYIMIIWLKYVGLGLAFLTYMFLIILSYRRNTVLRPLVKKLAVLYFLVLLIAGSSRQVNEPKLFMIAILFGINDYSFFWKIIDKYRNNLRHV